VPHVVVLVLGSDTDADFCKWFCFKMLRATTEAPLLLGMVLLPLLGDDTVTDCEEQCFRNFDVNDEAVLMLLLSEDKV